jgi:hypothetical protein
MSGNTLFTSDKNYMKRSPASGTYSMLGPSVAATFSYFYSDFKTPHLVKGAGGVPFIPMFRLYYEPFQDSKIWEAFQDTQNYFTNPMNTYGGTDDGPTALSWVDNTYLYVRLYFDTTALAAVNFPLYAIIYEDYGML